MKRRKTLRKRIVRKKMTRKMTKKTIRKMMTKKTTKKLTIRNKVINNYKISETDQEAAPIDYSMYKELLNETLDSLRRSLYAEKKDLFRVGVNVLKELFNQAQNFGG
jgi:DNA primase large subunit